jgi:hypothetical protein
MVHFIKRFAKIKGADIDCGASGSVMFDYSPHSVNGITTT